MTPANDNRKEGGGLPRGDTLFAAAAGAVVLLALAAGLIVMPSPWLARDLRIDRTLVVHLQAVQGSITNYRRINGKLPGTLADLLASPQTAPYAVTKENLGEIDYSASSNPDSYTLCATFLQDSAAEGAVYPNGWQHGAGKQCFPLKAPEKSSDLGNTYFVVGQRL